MIHDAFGRADANGCWRIRVDHCLQQCRRRGRGSLLEPRDRLGESSALGVTICPLELGQLQPAPERCGSNSYGLGSLIDVPVSQQGRDRLLLLAPEFLAMAYHLVPSAGRSSHHRQPFASPITSRILLLVFATGVMNVSVTVTREKERT